VAIQLDREAMIRLMHEEDSFRNHFMGFLLSRSLRTPADLVDHLFNSSEQRLARILLIMADFGQPEAMQEILDAVKKIGAKRLVIDSLAGFEMALAPGFRADFRESLYRMIGALTGIGVTVLSTVEIEESFTSLPFSTFSISFLTDDLIRLCYVEIEGELRKVMMVIKMRGGKHSKAIREYDISSEGVVIVGNALTGYRGLITGIPEPIKAEAKKRKAAEAKVDNSG
jgi:circadian clock protein KaiC